MRILVNPETMKMTVTPDHLALTPWAQPWMLMAFMVLLLVTAGLRQRPGVALIVGAVIDAPIWFVHSLPYSDLGALLLTIHIGSVLLLGYIWLIATWLMRKPKIAPMPATETPLVN